MLLDYVLCMKMAVLVGMEGESRRWPLMVIDSREGEGAWGR